MFYYMVKIDKINYFESISIADVKHRPTCITCAM
jgi:hypothetical protein